MSTLDAAFDNSGLIFGIYSMIIIAYGLFARPGRRGGAMSIAVVNYGGLIGLAAILAMPFISPFPVDVGQWLTGVLIEIFCATVFLLGSWEIVKFLRINAVVIRDRYLILLILAKLIFFIANYIAANGQYGIFSDDSRIDFLISSPILARTWYLDLMIDFSVFMSIGLRCVSQRGVRLQDLLGVSSIIFLSLLTGSKGSSFLLLAAAMLLIYAAWPKEVGQMPKWLMALGAAVGVSVVLGYIYLLSAVLQVSLSDQISLTLARFLLSADARIMAFDPNISGFVLSQPHGAFLSELFRGPARLFGFQTAEFQVGVYQYQYQSSTTNFVGSTNQLSALFMLYGTSFWLVEFLLVGGLMLFAYKVLQTTIRSRNSATAWASAASFFWLGDTLGKGYESYVQFLPICMLVILALVIMPKLSWALRRSARRSLGADPL
jgi:hypothetical protein